MRAQLWLDFINSEYPGALNPWWPEEFFGKYGKPFEDAYQMIPTLDPWAR
jgi:hypothetical protein